MDLIVSNLLDNFIKATKDNDLLKEDVDTKEGSKGDTDVDKNTCDKYVLSKKYIRYNDILEDNNKLIYFDAVYDNTFYNLINNLPLDSPILESP